MLCARLLPARPLGVPLRAVRAHAVARPVQPRRPQRWNSSSSSFQQSGIRESDRRNLGSRAGPLAQASAQRQANIQKDLDVLRSDFAQTPKKSLLALKDKWQLQANVQKLRVAEARQAVLEELQQLGTPEGVVSEAGGAAAALPASAGSRNLLYAGGAALAVAGGGAFAYLSGSTPIDVSPQEGYPAMDSGISAASAVAGTASAVKPVAAAGSTGVVASASGRATSGAVSGQSSKAATGSTSEAAAPTSAPAQGVAAAASGRATAGAVSGQSSEAATGSTSEADSRDDSRGDLGVRGLVANNPTAVYAVGGAVVVGIASYMLWLLLFRRQQPPEDDGGALKREESMLAAVASPAAVVESATEQSSPSAPPGAVAAPDFAAREPAAAASSAEAGPSGQLLTAARNAAREEVVFENAPEEGQVWDMAASVRGIPGNVQTRKEHFERPG